MLTCNLTIYASCNPKMHADHMLWVPNILIAIFYFFGQQQLSVHSSNFKHIDFHWTRIPITSRRFQEFLYQQPLCSIDLWNCIITRHLSQCEFCDEYIHIYIYREMCIDVWFNNMWFVHQHLCFGWMIMNNSTNLRVHKPLFDHSYHIDGVETTNHFHHLPSPSILFLLTNRPSQV